MGWTFNASGMGLMVLTLVVLTLGGVIYNNLTNTGFTNTSAYTAPNNSTCTSLQCPAYSSVTACSTPAQCQLGSFTFLNQASPITALVTGNLGQLVQDITQPSQANTNTAQPPFANFPNATLTNDVSPNDTGTVFFVSCIPKNGTTWQAFLGNNIKLNCNQVFSNATIVPQAQSKMFSNGFSVTSGNYNCTTANTAITTFIYQFIGCDTAHPFPAGAIGMMVAFNSSLILPPVAGTNRTVFGSGYLVNQRGILPLSKTNSNSPQVCVNIVPNSLVVSETPNCMAWLTAWHNTICNNGNGGNSACGQSTGVFGFLLGVGFIAGIVFLILGLGIGLNVGIFTNTFGMNPNAQGTRLAQVFGLGLVIFIPFLSEFGTWFGSSVLGASLSALVTFLLGGLFFFGLYQQTTLGTTGA